MKQFIIEILLNVVQPIPYMEFDFETYNSDLKVKISLGHILTILTAIRVYLTFKVLNHYNLWTNQRAKRISNLLGFEPDSYFATRVMLKTNPFFILSFISILFIVIIGTLIREFEYNDISQTGPFENHWNAYWLTIITMATSE
jgi:hypothetical protein